MSYYMGDYYRGGFFGSIFRAAKGFLGLGSAAPRPKEIPIAMGGPAGMTSSISSQVTNAIRGGKQILAKHPVLSAAAAAGALAMAGGGAALARRGRKGAALPAGLAGGTHRRRMHVTNVRALRRALRRTHGFAKLAMKVIRLEHPGKRKKFGGFRRRKKSRI